MACETASLEGIFDYIDMHQEVYVQRLRETVGIQSVSSVPELRSEVTAMVKYTADWIEQLGGKTKLCNLGMQTLPSGETIPLPPVVLGEMPFDPKRKTLCVYGHLDVQPAQKEDGWSTEPFVLTEIAGKMFGRGASDDKGPVACWLNCIEAYQSLNLDLPVNIKFCFEGMEESGSLGLDELIKAEKNDFFKGIDYICISDNYWLGKKKPCVTYGLKGILYFACEVVCAKKDLHSGVYGGTVQEAMSDLVAILDSLVDARGNILIVGVNDSIAPLTNEEKESYDNIDFDVDDLRSEIGAEELLHSTKEDLLMHRWRYPTLSLHGIEIPGAANVIASRVIGKFSIRLVPDQNVDHVESCVRSHIKNVMAERGSANSYKVDILERGKPWLADVNDPNYVAGRRAVKRVHGIDPDLTREGLSIPVTLTLQENIKKNVMLLPIGACDDSVHSQNEKLDRINYMNGIKLFAAYMYELSIL